MKKYILLPLLLSLGCTYSIIAQNSNIRYIDPTNTREGESVEYCRTHHNMNQLKSNPAFMKIFKADQEILRIREEQIKSSKQGKGTVYKIPVVFHVLHNGGIENISRAQILDAVDILNRDYRLQNADANNVQSVFQGMPADIEIEFVLASKAPNGQCFSGITRTQNALSLDGTSGQTQILFLCLQACLEKQIAHYLHLHFVIDNLYSKYLQHLRFVL
jgi:hypothetical protein